MVGRGSALGGDDRRRIGRRGEWIASLFLRLRGYRILARNLRTPVAEIDLLARRGSRMVICEVKTRRGDPGEVRISGDQRRRLARAARWVFGRWGSPGGSLRIGGSFADEALGSTRPASAGSGV